MRFFQASKGRLVFLCLFSLLAANAAAAQGEGLTVRQSTARAPHNGICSLPKAEAKLFHLADSPRTQPAVVASEVIDAKTTPLMANTIRQSYEALARYAEPAGKGISFQLSNFHTYDASEFDRIHWSDVVTMPGGDSIQVESRSHQAAANLSQGRTEYVPQWKPQDKYSETKEGQMVAGLSVLQAFQAALGDEPRLAAVSKLTAFDVTVNLDGRSRSYHAAFLWTEGRDGLTLMTYDYITGRVADGLVERFPPGHESPRVAPPTKSRPWGTKDAAASCVAEEVALRSFGLSQADSSDHNTGNHSVNGAFSADCVCNADCSQDCTSNGYGGCDEWGDVGSFSCHRISDPGFGSVDGHVSTGTATCAATAACAWKSCFACLCSGPTVSVSYSGVGASVGVGNTPFSAVSKGSSFGCPPCRTAPPPPPPGGGGGGGGGGTCDEGRIVTIEECEDLCDGWTDGEYCYVE